MGSVSFSNIYYNYIVIIIIIFLAIIYWYIYIYIYIYVCVCVCVCVCVQCVYIESIKYIRSSLCCRKPRTLTYCWRQTPHVWISSDNINTGTSAEKYRQQKTEYSQPINGKCRKSSNNNACYTHADWLTDWLISLDKTQNTTSSNGMCRLLAWPQVGHQLIIVTIKEIKIQHT